MIRRNVAIAYVATVFTVTCWPLALLAKVFITGEARRPESFAVIVAVLLIPTYTVLITIYIAVIRQMLKFRSVGVVAAAMICIAFELSTAIYFVNGPRWPTSYEWVQWLISGLIVVFNLILFIPLYRKFSIMKRVRV